MSFRINMTPAFAAWLALVAGCSGNAEFGAKKEDKAEKEENGGETEDETVDDPQQIAGAFLCGFLDDGQATAQTTPIGCGLFDENDQKVIDERLTYDVELRDENNDGVVMQTEPAPGESRWLVHAQLPNSHKDNGRLYLVTMSPPQGNGTDGAVGGASAYQPSIAVSDIGRSATDQIEDSSLELKEIVFHGYWDPGNRLGLDAGFDSNQFCDPSGRLRPSLTQTAVDAIKSTAAIVGGPIGTEITHVPRKISLTSSACFQPLKPLLGIKTSIGTSLYQQGAGKCLFARINDRLYIASKQAMPPEMSKALTPENLKEFTKEKACP